MYLVEAEDSNPPDPHISAPLGPLCKASESRRIA
jgi:hypothetical protein